MGDEPVVVSGGEDGAVQIWSLRAGRPVGKPLLGHAGAVTALAVAKVGRDSVVVSAGENGAIRIWDQNPGKPVGDPVIRHRGASLALAVATVGNDSLLVSGGEDGIVRVWDFRAGSERRALLGHRGAVMALAVAEIGDDAVAISGGEDGTIRVWDLRAGRLLGDPIFGHSDGVMALAVSLLDDMHLVLSSGGHAARVATRSRRREDTGVQPQSGPRRESLPGLVSLPALLGWAEISAATIRRSWASSSGISTPLGVSGGDLGVFEIDLVRDGPHGLLGGTSGSGKTEFLRSLVAGLAARNDPTRLAFVLIDCRGSGAAFASFGRLPHTVGIVGELDAQVAERVVRALQAEVEYREQVFAQAGPRVHEMEEYLATNPTEPMPRVLIVIDEVAVLVGDYPELLRVLANVAAKGRSLGVHIIFATQRPANVVSARILGITDLHIALRMQSPEDSVSVIGSSAAVSITHPGRAYISVHRGDIALVQTAMVGAGSTLQSWDQSDEPPLDVISEVKSMSPNSAVRYASTDLEQLISAMVEANAQGSLAAPRLPLIETILEAAPVTQRRHADRLLRLVDLREDDNVLEVGSGTGALAIEIGRRVRRVHGIDLSSAMVRQAEYQASRSISTNVTFEVADLLGYESTEPFDVVISNSAMQWITPEYRAYRQIFRLLRSGGRLGVQQGGKDDYKGLHAFTRTLITDTNLGKYFAGWRYPNYNPTAEQYRELLEGIGFTNIEIVAVETDESEYPEFIQDSFEERLLVPYLNQLPEVQREEFRAEWLQQAEYGVSDRYTHRLFATASRP